MSSSSYLRFKVLTAVKMTMFGLLGCNAVWTNTARWIPTFRWNILPSSSGLNSHGVTTKKPISKSHPLYHCSPCVSLSQLLPPLTLWSRIPVPQRKNITFHHYKDQLVNAVSGNSPCLQWESYKTHKYKMKNYRWMKQVGHIVTSGLLIVNAFRRQQYFSIVFTKPQVSI
jgi:hypothetical protein